MSARQSRPRPIRQFTEHHEVIQVQVLTGIYAHAEHVAHFSGGGVHLKSLAARMHLPQRPWQRSVYNSPDAAPRVLAQRMGASAGSHKQTHPNPLGVPPCNHRGHDARGEVCADHPS